MPEAVEEQQDVNQKRGLSSNEKAKICEEARKRFSYGLEQEKHNRDAMRNDTRFVYIPGAQWSQEIKNKREQINGDPCLEFNQMKQFTNQVVNDMRQKRPGVRVFPASGRASVKSAEILQGMVRGIEYQSGAEAVYDTGYLHTVVGGLGAWRIVSEYVNAFTFDQVLKIKPILDPLTVVSDPDYMEPDTSDKKWAFVYEELTPEEFKRKYPDAEPVSYQTAAGDLKEWWSEDGKKVLVADYYRTVVTKRTLVMMTNGDIGWKETMPKILPPGVAIAMERESEEVKVELHKLAGGDQVLESHKWPGKLIPVVLDVGDEIMIDGKRHRQGLIRHARDSQALFNFGMTAQAISLALTPRAPYIMAEGQNEGFEDMWDNANQRNFSALIYKPVQLDDGSYAPAPQRQQASMPDAGWIAITQQLQGLLKSTMGGLYENTLGQRGQETSGVAIHAREAQGDNATFHYADNHGRAIALTGRILIGAIPTFYSTERMVMVIDKEDKQQQTRINQQMIDPVTLAVSAIKKNDVTTGEFSVTVEAGKTWATRRQETTELMMEIASKNPAIFTVAGDILFKEMDIEHGEEISERMVYLMPPALQQSIAAKRAGEDPEKAQMAAQMQQMTEALQQTQQALQAAQGELEMVKKDKSASIAASQAKIQESQVRQNTEAQRADNETDMTQAKIAEIFAKVLLEYQKQATTALQASAAMVSDNQQQNQPGV